MFAACLDIGGEYAGVVVGAMNTAAQVGSFASALIFGYLVIVTVVTTFRSFRTALL